MPASVKVQPAAVLGAAEELDANRVQTVRVRIRQTELTDERRRVGSRRPAVGLIGDALSRRGDALAAGVRDDVPADTAAIDSELAELDAKLEALAGELRACAAVLSELTDGRAEILHRRHDDFVTAAREVADDGAAMLLELRRAAGRVQEHRGRVAEAVQLATGGLDDVDERRLLAATFSPWQVPRNAAGFREAAGVAAWQAVDGAVKVGA